MAIRIERSGARAYFIGDTYAVKDKIKGMGGHWDGDRKAWWVGAAKASAAEELASSLSDRAASEKRAVGDDSAVVAKAEYKGRKYYVLWMGKCKSGAEKAHLTVLDASIDFWVDLAACTILKVYEPRQHCDGWRNGGRSVEVHQTLGGLRRFIDRIKREKASGEPVCAVCGRTGDLVADLEDGVPKHVACCDIPPLR